MTKLQNNLVSIEIKEDEKDIFALDLTDHYNEPAMISRSKRGIEKAIDAIKESFSEKTRLYDVISILQKNNVRTHCWCMVD